MRRVAIRPKCIGDLRLEGVLRRTFPIEMFSHQTPFGKTQFHERSHFEHKITALAGKGCLNRVVSRNSRPTGRGCLLRLRNSDRSGALALHSHRAGRVYVAGGCVGFEPCGRVAPGQEVVENAGDVCADDSVFDRNRFDQRSKFERVGCRCATCHCSVCGGSAPQQAGGNSNEPLTLKFARKRKLDR